MDSGNQKLIPIEEIIEENLDWLKNKIVWLWCILKLGYIGFDKVLNK
jgi:hypothetical protein